MSLIEKLTPEQEALIPVYRDKWRAIALSTERIDRAKAAEAVKISYVAIRKQEPEIIFCDSPYAGLKIVIQKQLKHRLNTEFNNQLLYQFRNELRSQVAWQLENQLMEQLVTVVLANLTILKYILRRGRASNSPFPCRAWERDSEINEKTKGNRAFLDLCVHRSLKGERL